MTPVSYTHLSAHEVQELLEHPLLEFEDAITVSGEGSYLLPCRLLGMIPFKDIKVTPAEAGSVYVSGSTVGIYMETEGVLIIDTGEILCEGGTAREPAKNIVRPGDYIVAFNEQKVSNKKELMEDLEILDGEDVILDVIRNGEKIPVSLTPVKDAGGEYKLGIWAVSYTHLDVYKRQEEASRQVEALSESAVSSLEKLNRKNEFLTALVREMAGRRK